MRTPRPHQREALAYADGREACAFFMEMRLGKTFVAIRAALKELEIWQPVLVVTPATTIHVWERELRQEGLFPTPLVGSTAAKKKALEGRGDPCREWFLINPEGVRAWPGIATARPWELIIADETGGWLTNPKAAITKTLRKKFKDVPRKMILTGLPDPNGPEDYVEQMIFCFGEFMGARDFWQWRSRYMRPSFAGYGWELKPGTAKKIREAVNKLAFRKTAKQAGVFVPKVYERRHVEAPTAIRRTLREIKRDFATGEAETKYAAVAHNWQAMLAGGTYPPEYQTGGQKFNPFKVRELIKLLSSELKGKRVVVWARFIREIKEIHAALKAAGFPAARISGLTKAKFRPGLLRRFESGAVDVVVIQCSVGQYALNLSFADAQVFYSNAWDWGIRGQCEKRLDDMSKTAPVLIVDLLTKDTLDEVVLDTLKEKRKSSAFFARRILERVGA